MITAWLLAISMAFGPKILDLSLQFDDTARQSLRAKADADVPATLILSRDRPRATLRRFGSREGTARIRTRLRRQAGVQDQVRIRRRVPRARALTLNNMVQDPTMLHEALGNEVYQAAGVPVPRTSYVHLRVYDQDQGLYLNVETIDRRFSIVSSTMAAAFSTKAPMAQTSRTRWPRSSSYTRVAIPIARSSAR